VNRQRSKAVRDFSAIANLLAEEAAKVSDRKLITKADQQRIKNLSIRNCFES